MKEKNYLFLSRLSSIGFTIVICVVGSFFVGLFIDKYLKTSPLFMILCMLAGIIAAGYSVIRLANKIQKELDAKDDRNLQGSR